MPPPDLHPLPGRDVLVPVGSARPLRIHVAEHGRGVGRLPLLMLAEPPTTSYVWRDVARDLELDHRCFMPDLLGFGSSERPESRRSYAIDAQADMLRRLLDELELPRVALVAGGIAGTIALELTALAPDRIGALILLGTVLHADSYPVAPLLPMLPPGSGEVAAARLRGRHGRGRLAALLSTSDGADLDHYLAPLRQRGGGRTLLRLMRSVDMGQVDRALSLVTTAPPPALVLWGADDKQISADYGRRLAGQLAATWSPIAGAGHLVARERPERVAEEISGFLAEVG